MTFCLVLFYVEIRKAPIINDDDLSPFDDSQLSTAEKYKTVFCEHCLKRIDGFCNNGVKFRKIDDEMIHICEEEEFFEPK